MCHFQTFVQAASFQERLAWSWTFNASANDISEMTDEKKII